MNTKIFSLLLFPLLAILISGCGNDNMHSNRQDAALDLTGSKQGQAAGFIDVDGDGFIDKIVGAPYSSTTSGETGAVIIYKGTTAGFSSIPTKVITGDDNLGYSFVNLGDVDRDGTDDFAISAIHGDGEDVSLCGSVTIYQGGGNGQVIKKLSGEWPMDKFGMSLAAADLNDDGNQDIVVGAPFNTNDPALYQSGAVYVFFGPDFTTSTALYASSANKGLGWSVATGDIDGDGIADLMITANGKVLVFYGGDPFTPVITSPDLQITSSAAGFGKTLAAVGDIDGNPGSEIAIGAPRAALTLAGVSSRDVGSVYIVSAGTSTLIDLTASTPPANLLARIDGEALFNRFGSSIAAMGDVDNGGKPDFAVGAPMANAEWNILSGKVYLFKGENVAAGNPWSHSSVFTGTVKNQGYGTSLAFGNNALLIGAPLSGMDTGGVAMVDPATGLSVPGGSSGGSTGGSGECH